MNFVYTIFRQACNSSTGGNFVFIRNFFLFNILFFGGIWNIIISIFYSNTNFILFSGILVGALTPVIYFFFPGYKTLENEKLLKYSKIKVEFFFYGLFLLAFGIMALSYYILQQKENLNSLV
jgi:hypothetical protein